MDSQYLPGEGEQAVMVLRFLAASGCEEAVMAMIKEKPFIQYFIPPQSPTISRSDYVKHLAAVRPFLSLSFKDLLCDYAKSKVMVSQLIQKQNPRGSPFRPSDSLATQLKHLEDVMNQRETSDPVAKLALMPPEVTRVEIGVNTELPRQDVETSNITGKLSSSSIETQTELDTVPEDHDRDDGGGELAAAGVPLMFYNSLISDTSMPQKLATAINERFTESVSNGDGLVPKISSQVETEIDRFMLDLFPDEDNESNNSCSSLNSLMQKNLNGATATVQEPILDDRFSLGGLTNLFGDADSVIMKDALSKSNISPKKNNETAVAGPVQTISELTSINSESSKSNCGKDSNSIMLQSQLRQAPVKRIIPKPAPTGTPRPHPVFQFDTEDGLTVTEKKIVPLPGQYKHPYTIVTTMPKIKTSGWEILGRKSIEPKFPTTSPPPTEVTLTKKTPSPEVPKKAGRQPKIKRESKLKLKLKTSKKSRKAVPVNTTTVNTSTVSVNKRKAKFLAPVKLTPEKAKTHSGLIFYDSKHSAQTPSKMPLVPISTPKPKRVTLTPKAGVADHGHRLILVTEPISPAQPSSVTSLKSNQSNQPLTSYQYQTPAADKLEENNLIKLTNLSEVTPILDAFESAMQSGEISSNINTDTRNVKTRSPRLRGLIASAQKFKATTTQANLYRKSFSTPRKKHVRNLLFDTPPSTKQSDIPQGQGQPAFVSPIESFSVGNKTRSSSNCDVGSVPVSSPTPNSSTRKRKATNESPDKQTTSGQQSISKKKRLHWSEEDCYRSSAFPDRNFSSTQMKENMAQTANKILNVTSIISNSEAASASAPIVHVSPPTPCSRKKPVSNSNNAALPLPPIPEELIYIAPPTPTAEVEVVTSPLLEDGEIEDDSQSQLIEEEIDVESVQEEQPISSLKEESPSKSKPLKQSRAKHPAATASTKTPDKLEKFELKTGKKPRISKEKRKSVTKEKSSKKAEKSKSSSSTTANTTGTSTRGQLLHDLFGTDTDETPVKVRKDDPPSPVKPSPVKDKIVKVTKKVVDPEPALLPFQIIPAPIGFPDPTPIKKNPMGVVDFNQDSNFSNAFSRSNLSTLITPMKTSSGHNISPPTLNLPPTPRYIVNDPEAMDSRSNSNSNFTMFRSVDFLHTPLSTPFKFGPPPTPGRTIFLDERSQGAAISITTMNHQHYPPVLPSASSVGLGISGDSSNFPGETEENRRLAEKPLDLSSPIPPHRLTVRTMQAPQPQVASGSGPELSSIKKSKVENLEKESSLPVPPHVSINRKSPAVIVGRSSLSNLQSSTQISTSMLPPPRTENKRSTSTVAASNRGQTVPKIPPKIPNPSPPAKAPLPPAKTPLPPAKAPLPPAESISSHREDGNMKAKGTTTSRCRPPLNQMTSVEVNGKKTFLVMTAEKTILTPNETNNKSQPDLTDHNKTLGSKPKPVPTTAFSGVLKHFNINRFLNLQHTSSKPE